jgi:hypothetical protein
MEASIGWLIGFWMAIMLGVFLATPNNIWQKEAVGRGYALYCPNNGNFAWKGECENE